ncbi:hypothetical protein BpHYR1_018350 [Brachionus plicatilis]|uniref:Uncharacterized protein n=1 Tax=Brachionus plicatilis TaxID=10195 RepID=A0A3M7RA03_BRAPC|nr:hypothetical protein BpHYR1_018350 [Brachionus plicatilis]
MLTYSKVMKYQIRVYFPQLFIKDNVYKSNDCKQRGVNVSLKKIVSFAKINIQLASINIF